MADRNTPFIAIIGGFWKLKEDQEHSKVEEAKNLAMEIGAALAKAGMGLVVYYSEDESLEPHVVSGYVEAVPVGTGRGSIRVRFAESQTDSVKFAEQANRSELFVDMPFAGPDWEAPFYRSLVEAEGVDGVLLVAGSMSTFIAGQIALARPLPTLAVDQFGGAAGYIRTELAIKSPKYPAVRTHAPTQMVEWLRAECHARAEQRGHALKLKRSYMQHASQARKVRWAIGAFLALMLIVFFGMAQTPDPGLYPFLTFLGLAAAGATGALVRSLIWGTQQTSPITSALLGAVAGFAVGLAYLIPQFVGAPGVLSPSATQVEATDKIQFVSALLVAIPGGIGFDTVFTRMQKQMKDQPIGPPGQD